MGLYHHKCEEHGIFEVFTTSWAEYDELTEVYGRTEDNTLTVPCPDCSGVSRRDYSQGVAHGQVKGGSLYATENYRRGAEENWLRNEVKNTKEIVHGQKEGAKSPYSNYTVKDDVTPESMGMKKVSMDEAKQRGEAAKKSTGKQQEKVDKARKQTSHDK